MFSKSLDIPNVSRFCPSRSPRTVTRLEIHLKGGFSVACHKSGRPYPQLKYNTGFSAAQAPSILGTFGMHPKQNPGYANRARAAHSVRMRMRMRTSASCARQCHGSAFVSGLAGAQAALMPPLRPAWRPSAHGQVHHRARQWRRRCACACACACRAELKRSTTSPG